RLGGHHKILSEKGSGRGQVTMSLPGPAGQQPPSGTFHVLLNTVQAPCQTERNGPGVGCDSREERACLSHLPRRFVDGLPDSFCSVRLLATELFSSHLAFFPFSRSAKLRPSTFAPPEPAMRVPEHPTLIRRMLDSRLKKLTTTSPVLAASLTSSRHRCG